MVRWSIVHECQTLIKCIFNNIEVNCIGEIVPQTIFLRGGVRLTHLGGGAYFKGRSLNLRRESIEFWADSYTDAHAYGMHVLFVMADGLY